MRWVEKPRGRTPRASGTLQFEKFRALFGIPHMHPMASQRPGERARAWAALFAIVVLAAVVRWCFFVGMGLWTGDVLNRLHVQWPQSGSATGPLSETLLQYPRWVWLRSPDGAMPFGYLFYALVPAVLYVVARRPAGAHVPLIWGIVPTKARVDVIPIMRR